MDARPHRRGDVAIAEPGAVEIVDQRRHGLAGARDAIDARGQDRRRPAAPREGAEARWWTADPGVCVGTADFLALLSGSHPQRR